MEIKLFNRWDTKVKVNDPGLERYISLKQVILPRTHGRARKQFHKSEMNIIERLMNHLLGPGHRGKRHLISSADFGGKHATVYNIIKKTLEIIEKKTKKNPIEVVVRAIENAALREEITSYRLGGIMVRKAVITSPQRRVDLALRLMTQASYQKAHNSPKKIEQCLSEEIIAAYDNDSQKSHAIKERERIEREAGGAR